MDKLNRLKGTIKGSVTKLETFVQEKTATKDASSSELEVKLKKIENLQAKLDDLREKYYEIPDIKDITEIESDLEDIENRLEGLEVSLKTFLDSLKNSSNVKASNISEIETNSKTIIKLPEIPLPIFTGKYDEWSTFKAQFTNLIINNEQLNESQKLYYLRASLTGDAKQIETSDDSFESLFVALKERFENQRLLVDTHLLAIINYDKIQHESAKELRSLIDCVKKNLRALKVLEYEQNNLSDVMLLNIILQKLDKETRKHFESTLKTTDVPNFDNFLDFLEKRSLVLASINRSVCVKPNKSVTFPPNKTKSFIINSNENIKCLLCKGSHYLYKCVLFKNMDVPKRYEFVRTHKLCMNCFNKSHIASQCKSKYSCLACKKKHNSLLHRSADYWQAPIEDTLCKLHKENKSNSSSYDDSLDRTENATPGVSFPQPLHSLGNTLKTKSTILLTTAVIHVYDSCGERHKFKAILDSASQINLMSSECANILGLKREKAFAPVSGINDSIQTIKSKVRGVISNESNDFSENLEFLVVPKITDLTPSNKLEISGIELPKFIELADPEFYKPGKVHLLLGAELFFKVLKYEKIQVNDFIILKNSVFGYLVSGRLPGTYSLNQCLSLKEQDQLEETIAQFWELESVEDLTNRKSDDELFCENHFQETYSRDERGRYVVQMPLREDPQKLGDSKEIAWRRLTSLWNRLSKNPKLCLLYKEFMREYEELGHMQLVNEEREPEVTYYIPHHSIYRPEKSTTKLRVVFNASTPSSNGTSLNSLQVNGGIVQEDLFSIMSRFRTHRIALTADVQKMYRMISIDPIQRDLQRILWKVSQDDPVKIYRLNTVTYGTTSAPYLATRTLKQIAIDEGSKYPLASPVVHTDFYVDDLVTGVKDVATAIELQKQLIYLLNAGGMKLHKWSSNEKCLLQHVPYEDREYRFDKVKESVKTLGLIWNPKDDIFKFSVATTINTARCTKRSVISDIAKLFDPLGLLGPIIVKAKIFMQRLWMLRLDWDQPLPDKEALDWKKFAHSLQAVERVHVKRYVLNESDSVVELHGFSDASKDAYGAAVYLRCVSSSGEITVNLLCSKSRVAPIKPVTIPRLELCAAELLSKLVKKLLNSLRLELRRVYLWTDSTIVLSWIQTNPHVLKTFVANRISRIQELSGSYCWQHIKSEENPADLVSRGLCAEKISECRLWWCGPAMLQQELSISSDIPVSNDDDFVKELKKDCSASLALTSDPEFLDNILSLTNDFLKLIRICSFAFRFLTNARNPHGKCVGPLSSQELWKAQMFIIKQIQVREFPNDLKSLTKGEPVPTNSKLKCLNPFIDKNSILRIGGRLVNSDLRFDQKHPIILPKESKLTKMIFEYFHRKNFHAGPQTLLYAVRQEFWPISGRGLARKIVKNCIICCKQNPKICEQIMGDLPSERVSPTSPFNISGVDFCGPFYIKSSGKRRGSLIKIYLAIFICFVTKAMHLEIVSELTSAAFIACLKRFVSRRGKCAVLYSDNATNFVGTCAELKRLYELVRKPNDHLGSYLSSEQISWKFIPPRSPNFGGLWEAGVKSVKHYLRRTVGNANLTYEEFLTVIIQIEGILNSRPITPLSSDPNDFQALTPGHFLIGRPLNAIPEPSLLEIKDNRLSRWQLTTKIVQGIWRRWKKDYLNNLQQRSKWFFQKGNVEKDNLVLIKEDNLPPAKWSLGRIMETIQGSDGNIRVVIVKTPTGVVKRGVSKICILPMNV